MGKEVLIIQRFYYNFREGFFEYLSDIKFNFKLINATSSRGKVKVHDGAKNIAYIERNPMLEGNRMHIIMTPGAPPKPVAPKPVAPKVVTAEVKEKQKEEVKKA